jgi:hypothetical protein
LGTARDDIPIVHVTPYNELMWDNGRAPTVVIGHGVVDPGYRYTGLFDRAATMINEPIRRTRVTGFDLRDAIEVPSDLYGIGMPVVVVGSTEAFGAAPSEAGVVATDRRVLANAVRRFVCDPAVAEVAGKAARHAAMTSFGLDTFLTNWDRHLADIAH